MTRLTFSDITAMQHTIRVLLKRPRYSALGLKGAALISVMLWVSTAAAGSGHHDARLDASNPLSPESLDAFWREYRVVEPGEAMQELAYVIGGENQRLLHASGDTIFARGSAQENVPENAALGIYRQTQTYTAEDGTPLGQALTNIGQARHLRTDGDMLTLEIRRAHQEVRRNDLILALEQHPAPSTLRPHFPLHHVSGRILGVPGGLRFIGRMQIVSVDMGIQDGLQAGHILQVNQPGETLNDPRTQAVTQLPPTPSGKVMVIKPYQQVSFALVMQASNVLEIGDRVVSPDQ
ncbi:MAG: peptidoglycan-binding protein [Halomonas sp.]|nr:peptidoglycan-binding protein [Halomonas sp.]MBP5981501.1 peptidoglycan-binding protein [Halomonas sp.]